MRCGAILKISFLEKYCIPEYKWSNYQTFLTKKTIKKIRLSNELFSNCELNLIDLKYSKNAIL